MYTCIVNEIPECRASIWAVFASSVADSIALVYSPPSFKNLGNLLTPSETLSSFVALEKPGFAVFCPYLSLCRVFFGEGGALAGFGPVRQERAFFSVFRGRPPYFFAKIR